MSIRLCFKPSLLLVKTICLTNVTKIDLCKLHKSLPHLPLFAKPLVFCKVHLAANRCQIISKTDMNKSKTFLRPFFFVICLFFIRIFRKKGLPVAFYSVLRAYTARLSLTTSPASTSSLILFLIVVG